MMKKNYIHIYLLGILLLLVACTGKFREFNTDQSGITDEDLMETVLHGSNSYPFQFYYEDLLRNPFRDYSAGYLL